MSFSFATWNINSVRMRAPLVLDWLNRHSECQLLALQEIKCETEQFPSLFEENGFHCYVKGQKSYNGVAFISRQPVTVTTDHLPGFDDPAARYIEVATDTLRIGNLYLPNGNSGGEKGFQTKLSFLEALYQRARTLLDQNQPFAFIGDYNVCPTDNDLARKALSEGDALIAPASRAGFRRLLWAGLTDAVRALRPEEKLYTFWDYQAAAFQRNSGLRIDHALLSPSLADRLESTFIDRDERTREKPSDHVPVMVTLA
ncbi:exodeoxyribonuclease III [Acetobacteraceae bacterium ESL0709]|nr:exodeoxyribonuclease III [Acetobacteraceae bacterium ESL0697]MDF7677675.1 exodeoxyribonuclease III [Acetobacteraceae bacterium ESL0709]